MAFPGTFYSPYGGGNATDPRSNYGSPYGGAAAAPAPPPNANALPNYNITPQPTGGNGAYGLVPGTIGIPPSTWQQLSGINPSFDQTSGILSNIKSEIEGDLTPQQKKNIQDIAARFGVSSGMPGSNAVPNSLAFNKTLRDVGLDTYAVQQQGQKDYLSLLQGVGGQQTPQGLAAEIAAHNAQLRAAPDPAQAAERQLANYWNALNALRGPGGGTGQGPGPQGGTGTLAPQALGFGGISGGSSLGVGFGSPVSRNANTGTGPGFGGVPGQPGMAYNDLMDMYGDTTPIDYTGGLPQDVYDFWSGGTPVNPGGVNYDQGVGGFGVGYDQSAPPQIPSDMSNEDYFYNFGG